MRGAKWFCTDLQRDGYDEITDGLRPGETVAVDGAIFLSNILFGGAS